MSFENPNQSENIPLSETEKRWLAYEARLASKAEREVVLKDRLDKVVALPYEEEWVQAWMTDILIHEGGDEEIENFFENVSKSEFIKNTLHENISLFETLFYELGKKVFEDHGDAEAILKVVVHNMEVRHEEKSRNEKDKKDRILLNPFASDEEYRLGAYKESIESQVRDAVFELQKKGYLPIESGFHDAEEGSQYIGIAKEEGVDFRPLEEVMKSIGVSVHIYKDRVQLMAHPKDKMMSLDEWKELWDTIIQHVPDRSDLVQEKKNSENGLQGVDFREMQDKIKEGKNAWLRSGFAFVNGKVVSMSYQDFMNLDAG